MRINSEGATARFRRYPSHSADENIPFARKGNTMRYTKERKSEPKGGERGENGGERVVKASKELRRAGSHSRGDAWRKQGRDY